MSTNTELIAEAKAHCAGIVRQGGCPHPILDRLVAGLEVAEAEATRRGEALEDAWTSYQSKHGYSTYPTQPDTGADFTAGFEAGAALADAPASSEAVKAAAREESYRRYDGDTVISEETGERESHDDWGYAECQRAAFIAGTEWRPASEGNNRA